MSSAQKTYSPGSTLRRLPAQRFSKPATKTDWGGVSGYFADPDGYPWEVVWAPNSKFKPDGSLDIG